MCQRDSCSEIQGEKVLGACVLPYLGLMTPTTMSKTNTGIEAVLPISASGDQQPRAKPSEAPAVVSNEKVAVTCFQPMRKPETFLSTDVKILANIESMGSSASTLAARYSCIYCNDTEKKKSSALILLFFRLYLPMLNIDFGSALCPPRGVLLQSV